MKIAECSLLFFVENPGLLYIINKIVFKAQDILFILPVLICDNEYIKNFINGGYET